jgi:hypothetical protein
MSLPSTHFRANNVYTWNKPSITVAKARLFSNQIDSFDPPKEWLVEEEAQRCLRG